MRMIDYATPIRVEALIADPLVVLLIEILKAELACLQALARANQRAVWRLEGAAVRCRDVEEGR